ncbi:glutamine cyclotransferase [Corynebacterium diphtheriae]|uniref:glutaminyl-peptide cyclotransferase n=1 Tax=Corynebacterium diphtheriae TaxID=1717 RepID=UPI0008FB328E|nr:glutaminyl-peptide cyclotransferase [Corynebacterium diphtheriae]MBG9253349.1 glutaminyl-peptide cyclotransferase [Corynebacterium diphtheriae bv. mitis]OIR72167.1 glutamine cyclotransferase [Corynebacterium diphtheriae]OIR72867.1 glutamine cyclotransferase [Corynebacterium diphtheriae]OIR79577.1 glutamine cyclotransferase [Corynebacterium diphtheriae]OIR99526.1 glutamine cyclotransferase [Corynebacterium diphtheriae]
MQCMIDAMRSIVSLISHATVALAGSLAVAGCSLSPQPDHDTAATTPERLEARIHKVHRFDPQAFTQGLELDGDRLLVSTGFYGESGMFSMEVGNAPQQRTPLAPELFGEGITKTGDHIWQLTWHDGIAFKRDATTFQQLGTVAYEGEGWGLCHFDDRIIMSNGSDELIIRDPESFDERSRIQVTNQGNGVSNLNELECVPNDPATGKDTIYANVFLSTDIMRIDATTGAVTGIIDASNIPNNAVADSNNVLNGIAWIPGSDRFYITGKRWPDLYEVTFVSKMSNHGQS